jgi:hypothetical protein
LQFYFKSFIIFYIVKNIKKEFNMSFQYNYHHSQFRPANYQAQAGYNPDAFLIQPGFNPASFRAVPAVQNVQNVPQYSVRSIPAPTRLEEISHTAKKILQFFGGVFAGGVLTPAFGASTLFGGVMTGAFLSWGLIPLAIITGGMTAGSGYMTYKSAELSYHLFKAAFTE